MALVFLCLCKGLNDSDVRRIANTLTDQGVPSIESFLESLDLEDQDACGLCAQAQQQFVELAIEEWVRLGVRYEDSRWQE